MKEDLFGYDRYRIPCKYLSYNRIDLDLNRLITLPSRLYKTGKDPLEFISYSIQSNKDIGHRVLRRSDGPNLSKSLSLRLVSLSGSYYAYLHQSSITVVYPSTECRSDFVESDRDLHVLNRKHDGVQIKLHGTRYGSAATSTELIRLTEEKRERDRNECSVLTDGKRRSTAGVRQGMVRGAQSRIWTVAGRAYGERPTVFPAA